MTTSDEPGSAPRQRGSFGFLVVLVALAMVAYVALRSNRSAEPKLSGVALPPLEVAGWFNVARPVRNEDLRGKVVLVDCWFVDCPPCRAAMPRLVEFHRRFRDSGLELIGLTLDSGSDVPRAERTLAILTQEPPGAVDHEVCRDSRSPRRLSQVHAPIRVSRLRVHGGGPAVRRSREDGIPRRRDVVDARGAVRPPKAPPDRARRGIQGPDLVLRDNSQPPGLLYRGSVHLAQGELLLPAGGAGLPVEGNDRAVQGAKHHH